MPMNFPDMQSLSNRAGLRGFRQPNGGETEQEYREAFAEHVRPIDFVESMEIQTGKGWDKWDTNEQILAVGLMLLRK